MGQFQKERNGNFMGNPSSTERMKGKKSNPFFDDSAKAGKVVKGMEAHDPDSFPDDGGAGKSFKNQRSSKIGKGSI